MGGLSVYGPKYALLAQVTRAVRPAEKWRRQIGPSRQSVDALPCSPSSLHWRMGPSHKLYPFPPFFAALLGRARRGIRWSHPRPTSGPGLPEPHRARSDSNISGVWAPMVNSIPTNRTPPSPSPRRPGSAPRIRLGRCNLDHLVPI
jgi:hypothetical protein